MPTSALHMLWFMARDGQHRIAAAVLAMFSADAHVEIARERQIWVKRRNAVDGLARREKTNNVNYAKGIYDFLDVTDYDGLETLWGDIEARIVPILSRFERDLRSGEPVNLRDFIGFMVPHFAATLVRGVDFDERNTIDDAILRSSASRDNANMRRGMDCDQLTNLLLRRRFIFLFSEGKSFIQNDIGYTLMPGATVPSLVLPINPGLCVEISAELPDSMLLSMSRGIQAGFAFRGLEAATVSRINHQLAADAAREVYGRTEEDVALDWPEAIPARNRPAPKSVLTRPEDRIDPPNYLWQAALMALGLKAVRMPIASFPVLGQRLPADDLRNYAFMPEFDRLILGTLPDGRA